MRPLLHNDLFTGAMNQRISLQTPSESRGTTGATLLTFGALRDVWAQVLDVVPQEGDEAHRVVPRKAVEVIVRYASDITPLLRVVIGSRTFGITGVVDPDGRKRKLILHCEEQTA